MPTVKAKSDDPFIFEKRGANQKHSGQLVLSFGNIRMALLVPVGIHEQMLPIEQFDLRIRPQ